ncbi:hypothetical protein [Pelagibius sp. Alg239-R121]|uniref:hypothetical protein n=1 Tax=Pelagibius sp. Alg239-R121 TaxID=2993448 RepID=UPI0024A6B35C|nr:hypothetical protein [Pelagibius sp. Alg239-R121]
METWTTEGAYADVESTEPRYLTIVASKGKPVEANGEAFQSVTVDGSYLSVEDASSLDHGKVALATAMENPSVTSAMLTLVSRDYGMFERTEAPQYFPAINSTLKGYSS